MAIGSKKLRSSVKEINGTKYRRDYVITSRLNLILMYFFIITSITFFSLYYTIWNEYSIVIVVATSNLIFTWITWMYSRYIYLPSDPKRKNEYIANFMEGSVKYNKAVLAKYIAIMIYYYGMISLYITYSFVAVDGVGEEEQAALSGWSLIIPVISSMMTIAYFFVVYFEYKNSIDREAVRKMNVRWERVRILKRFIAFIFYILTWMNMTSKEHYIVNK